MTLLLFVFAVFGFVPTQDTVSLEQVDVYAPALDRFAQGQKTVNFGAKLLEAYSARSLGDLLQEKSPVFIRQYGAGMLASPSFRGTSAGHTAVFWNGVPINSPSLGQSDLSVLPVEAIDQVQLQFGSSGALFGNEAIGGSVHLASKTEFGKGVQATLAQTVGSFGLFNSAVSGGFSSKNFSTKTRIYRQFAKNDFGYRDLSQPGTPEVKEDHAQVEQVGAVQDLAWNLSPKAQLKGAFWWQKSDREIQPVMGSNTTDRQSDESIRAVVDYFRFGKTSTWNLKTGLVQDRLIFNGSENRTRQFFLAADYDFEPGADWKFKAGVRATLAKGDLSTYSATDQRYELYQSARWQTTENLSLSLNLRQFAYPDGFVPFLPGIGGDWRFLEGEKHELLLKASLGKGFKVPTLNDRFWVPGGNPELLPEESINGEIGLHWSGKGIFSWDQSLTYYHMQVDNWIIWLPRGSLWSPENVREVRNQGLEYQGKADWKLGNWSWEAAMGYTYSRALDLTTEPENPRQLPYTPEHQANGSLSTAIAGLSMNLSTFYIGQRAIGTGNARIIDSYQIWNAGLSFSKLKWGKARFPLGFQALNLLDREYQVLYLRAMPGRSYQLNLTIAL